MVQPVAQLLRGPYDALVRSLRADPAIASVSLAPAGGCLAVAFANGVTLDIAPTNSRSGVFLSSLNSPVRREGRAGSAMRTLLAHAASCGAGVEIQARPYGSDATLRLEMDELKAFYARLGFVPARHGLMAFRP